MHFSPFLVPSQGSYQYVLVTGVLGLGSEMNTKLAEYIVAAIVVAWLLSVVVALIDPMRAGPSVQAAPVIGTIAGGAIAVLTLKRKNGNGKT